MGGVRRTVVVLAIALAAVLPTEAVARPLAEALAPRRAGYEATISRIPRHLRQRIVGSSWRPGCPVPLRKLRLVKVTYLDFSDERRRGRLVVHRAVARGVTRVFRDLYRAGFPIRRMELVDRYGADDMRSMRADNTSAFNCRYRDGVCCRWSMHAYGRAIDVNPVENPYVGSWGVSPPNGAAYVDRSPIRRGMIAHGDEVWRAFRDAGWSWGGDWGWPVDYQHFSTNGR